MPGNGGGERFHNFFGQENLSHGQHHQKVVEGMWPGLGNNQWIGGQRQIGTPFISDLKNYTVPPSADSERTVGQSSSEQHNANFSPAVLRPEFTRSQSQNQQLTLNGYMDGSQVFQARQNEASFLGVDPESGERDLTSRGFFGFEAETGSSDELQKKTSARMDFSDSLVNFDFFVGQRQMGSMHPGMFQSMQRQQSGISEMQLLQQQVMFKQMQEIQRQQQYQQQKQQLQQQEARRLNAVNQVSSLAKQAPGSHPSALINGIPVHDTSTHLWHPELMAANMNWPAHGMASAVQGSSSAMMFTPSQVQGPQLIGMIPQQVNQSLYSVPDSGNRFSSNQNSPVQMDRSALQYMSGSRNNSVLGDQSTGFPDQSAVQDNSLVSREEYQGKNVIRIANSRGLNGGSNLEAVHEVDLGQSNGPGQGFHESQDVVGPSETSQDGAVVQVSLSQNVATLDPTEEKILFGSDGNLWEAFGRGTNIGSGGNNMLDGTDMFGAFPSVQSGSWSALMQSAVGETSSADAGLQEEWSGLTFQSSQPQAANHLAPPSTDCSKQQFPWADNRSEAGSMANAKPYNLSDGTRTSINCNNMPGVKQSGVSSSHEQSEMSFASSTKPIVQPFSGEGSKWLGNKLLQKPISECHNINEKGVWSPAELNVKRPCSNQLGVPSYHTGDQPNKPNGWKLVNASSRGTGGNLINEANENLLLASQSNKQKSPMFERTYGAGIWKNESVSNSIVALENAKSTTSSPHANREYSDLNKFALPDSNSLRSNQDSNQQLPNGNNIDIWKHADSSQNSMQREFAGKHQSLVDNSHQTFESSGNNNLCNVAKESCDYRDTKDGKTDGSHGTPHCSANSVSGSKENTWLDANDTSQRKIKASSNTGKKSYGIRKFQYHPMGDLDVDVEPVDGTKRATHVQSTATHVSQGLKGHDHDNTAHSKHPLQIARNSMEIDKGRFPGFSGQTKGSDEMIPKNRFSGSATSTSTSLDQAAYSYAASKTTPPSQNMLELLHKVDKSRVQGKSAANLGSSDCIQSSEIHDAKNSARSVHYQYQSSTSRGFGLQLAPPTQLLPVQDHAFSSQGSPQTIKPHSSTSVLSEVGEMGQPCVASTSSDQALPSYAETSQGLPYSRSLLQNQQTYDMGGKGTSSQSGNAYFDRFASMNESFERAKSGQPALASVPNISRSTLQNSFASSSEMPQQSITIQNNAKDSPHQFPVLESLTTAQVSTMSGTLHHNISSKMQPALWNSVSTRQYSFGTHPFKISSNMVKSNAQPSNDFETTSCRQQKVESHSPSESGACSGGLHGFDGKDLSAQGDQLQRNTHENDSARKIIRDSQGKESLPNSVASTSTSNPNSTQKEIEAFGRSLRPNDILHQNYDLVQQLRGMKNVDGDPDNRCLKRLKGSGAEDAPQVGSCGGLQLYDQNNAVRDASTSFTSNLPGDSKMLPAKSTDFQDINISSQCTLTPTQNVCHSFADSSTVSVGAQHSQISPQMAPSWFDRYGTFKSGQILPLNHAQNNFVIKSMELPFSVGTPSSLHAYSPVEQRSVAADASHHGLLHRDSTSLMGSENLSSSHLMNPDAANALTAALKPDKHVNASLKLVPWHKQIVPGFQVHQNISSAELQWARAANRLTEMVEGDVEVVDDRPPVLRSKRRLMLTRKLMQMLFCPPPASALSADAMSHYENVIYFLARQMLGDACSTFSCTGSDNNTPSSSGNLVPQRTSQGTSDQYFTNVVEDLISRAKKVENDLSRLDKRASFLDLRVEYQELEKISVLSRFAKFHSRGQVDGAETLSDASANAQKSCLQRYVTAFPVPRNLPDGVQCFSL